jgi:hypothetical protein
LQHTYGAIKEEEDEEEEEEEEEEDDDDDDDENKKEIIQYRYYIQNNVAILGSVEHSCARMATQSLHHDTAHGHYLAVHGIVLARRFGAQISNTFARIAIVAVYASDAICHSILVSYSARSLCALDPVSHGDAIQTHQL